MLITKKRGLLLYGLSFYFSLLALNLFTSIYPPLKLAGFPVHLCSLLLPITYFVLERLYSCWRQHDRWQLLFLTLFFHLLLLLSLALIGWLQPIMTTDISTKKAWYLVRRPLLSYGLGATSLWALVCSFLSQGRYQQKRILLTIFLATAALTSKLLGGAASTPTLFLATISYAAGSLLVRAPKGAASSRCFSPSYPTLYLCLLFFFWSLLLVTNLATTSFISLLGYSCTMGLFFYPFTFLITDFITEYYNDEAAIQAVWGGFLATATLSLTLLLLPNLPSQASRLRESFWLLFNWLPGVFLASITAYLIAQRLDIYLFSWLKRATAGRYLWLRNNLATLLSEAVDTAIFALILWGVWPWLTTLFSKTDPCAAPIGQVWLVVKHEYLIKAVLALLDTPFLYLMLYLMRRRGRERKKSLIAAKKPAS